jgi:protein SCO1/2
MKWPPLALAAALTPLSIAAQEGLPGPLQGVGIEQRLGEQVPLDVPLRDEEGREVPFGQLLDDKPVVLSLVYYQCPMLCTEVLSGLVRALRALPFDAGREFRVITVSFDPNDTPELAAARKRDSLARYGREGAETGWRFLTGSEDAVRRLTESVGFRYTFDRDTRQFAHASGLMLLTPRGVLSRYFYGIEYSPRDLRLGLVEASSHRIGSPVDQILLYCFHYDPTTGKYGLVIMNVLRVAGVLTVLGLGGFVTIMLRREKRT